MKNDFQMQTKSCNKYKYLCINISAGEKSTLLEVRFKMCNKSMP